MNSYDWISFSTDYGRLDGFVAACHGVIAGIAPTARVIDVTHLVPPGDIRRGALVLAQTVRYLPPAVHVAVVDPGVGTTRRAVAIETERGALVGPDNGLLPWAADALGGARRVVALTREEFFVHPVRQTFHGRDIFAPVGAHLAVGRTVAEVGDEVDAGSLVRLPAPLVATGNGWLDAEVLTVDGFGNIQLAGTASHLDTLAAPGRPVDVAGLRAVRGATFADVADGELVVYIDAADQIAVAANNASAVAQLPVTAGQSVRITVVSD